MKLKQVINDLFDDNTDYKNPGQDTNQASSLTSLSTDLYTDSKRFVYELLQNADDSGATEVVVTFDKQKYINIDEGHRFCPFLREPLLLAR